MSFSFFLLLHKIILHLPFFFNTRISNALNAAKYPSASHKRPTAFAASLFEFSAFINDILQLLIQMELYHKSILHSEFPDVHIHVIMPFRLFHPSVFHLYGITQSGTDNFHRTVSTSSIWQIQNQNNILCSVL